jgi:ABC-type dipeptide/oligopeptide/nickel transport system permease component
MNVVLIERVLSVPGFFRYTWKALGHTEPPTIDYPMLQAITHWAAVLIIGVGLLSDALVAVLDPRIRPGRRRSA